MSELIKKQITISSVETKTTINGAVIFKIKSDKETFSLWKTKVDGSESKAYSTFKSFGMDAVGRTVEVLYKEQPKTFTDAKGQEKNYTQRTIVVMSAETPQTPDITQTADKTPTGANNGQEMPRGGTSESLNAQSPHEIDATCPIEEIGEDEGGEPPLPF